MLAPLAMFAVFIPLSADAHTAAEFALAYGGACLTLAELLGTANPALRTQGWMVAGALAAAVAWALYPAFARSGGQEP